MTPVEAPPGTVLVLGSMKNGVTATRQRTGQYTYNHYPHAIVPWDDIDKMGTAIYIPGEER